MSKTNKFTKKQFSFIKAFVLSRSVQESSIKAGFSESFSKSKAYQLVKRPDIQEEIAKQAKIYYGQRFDLLGLVALESLEEIISDGSNRAAQLSAVKFIFEISGVHEESNTIVILSDSDKRKKIDFTKNKFLGNNEEWKNDHLLIFGYLDIIVNSGDKNINDVGGVSILDKVK